MANLLSFQVDDVECGTFNPYELLSGDKIAERFCERGVEFTGIDSASSGWLPSELHGLFSAMITAYDEHYPLILSPDHLFQTILESWSEHVSHNSDDMHHMFVQHAGKMQLKVRNDSLVKADQTNPWGAVIQAFSEQIVQNINNDLFEVIKTKFTTTTSNEIICRRIALMATTKHYFKHRLITKCGFPLITLAGVKNDWVLLKHSIDKLGKCMIADFALNWIPTLHSIVDKFIDIFDGKIDKEFWRSMVKYYSTKGSGGDTYVTGWVNGLFPYLRNQPNPLCIPWETLRTKIADDGGPHKARGGRVSDYARRFCVAPIEWSYYGTMYDLEIKSSIIGAQQAADGTITPQIAWAVVEKHPH